MARTRRFGRPTSGDILQMMLVNLGVASLVLFVTYLIFGNNLFVGMRHPQDFPDGDQIRWILYGLQLPGAAIGYGLLWYWLILTGRNRGLSWGSALCYGVGVACLNLPVSGFCIGLLYGDPLFAMLLAFISLLLIPALAVAMLVYGLIMGSFNGWAAQRWMQQHRPPSGF